MNPCPPPEVPETLLHDGATELCRGCGLVWIRHTGVWRQLVPIEQHAWDQR